MQLINGAVGGVVGIEGVGVINLESSGIGASEPFICSVSRYLGYR
jgi:hypothetical protein